MPGAKPRTIPASFAKSPLDRRRSAKGSDRCASKPADTKTHVGANRAATGATTSSSARTSRSPVAPAGKGTLTVRPGAVGAAGLVEAAGSGIEAILMGRDVTDPVVVPEQGLGAVAVVHVPVDDDHALAPASPARRPRRQRCSTGKSPSRGRQGVMTRRPGHDERRVTLTVAERVDRGEPGARRLAAAFHDTGPAYVSGSSLPPPPPQNASSSRRYAGSCTAASSSKVARRASTSMRSVPNIRSSMPAAAASTRLGRSGWPGCMCSTDTTGPATISFGTPAILSTHALLDERAQ